MANHVIGLITQRNRKIAHHPELTERFIFGKAVLDIIRVVTDIARENRLARCTG